MKRRIVAAISACAILAGGISQLVWGATDAVQEKAENIVEKGIMEGYEDGQLHLEDTLTRAQFSKLLYLAAKDCGIKLEADLSSSKGKAFPDVQPTHWAAEYISAMSVNGIINGFEDGTFRPDETVTCEQAAKMTAELFGLPIYSYDGSYPEKYVAAMIGEGINDGSAALIGEALTRGDAAAIISNAIDYFQSDLDNDDVYSYNAGGSTRGILSSVQSLMPAGGASKSAAVNSTAAVDSGAVYEEAADMSMPGFAPSPYIYDIPFNTESYTAQDENVFKDPMTSPLSTFSIDCDTASYSNMRRFITEGSPIPNGAVRTEELINYFDYDYDLPSDGTPFAVTTEVAQCPWNSEHLLASVAVQGDELRERKASNIVFLVDVSGSMYSKDKLPLVKRSLNILLEKLDPEDTVSIVTYASGVSTVLDGEKAENKDKIKAAFDSLHAGGGTYGSEGLNKAYEDAQKHMKDGGNNRIILCTDGDFNIGPSSDAEMEKLITEKRDMGIFISVLGFGMGNYKDSKMELIADKGNGNYAYIDNIREAKKVLADDMTKTLFTIAKDVKIQVEFNPDKVGSYRLIGYENRKLNNEDFNNDSKDAGELGAGASVTALYEIIPANGERDNGLTFTQTTTTGSDALMLVKLRYKDPDGAESKLIERTVAADTVEMSENMRFASSLAELGMILNESEYKGSATLDTVEELARTSLGVDEYGLRREFLHLVDLLRYKYEHGYEGPVFDN